MKPTALPPRLEAWLVGTVFHLFRLLPLDLASAIGGWIGRNIGYRLPATRRARRNLERCFADQPTAEREAILKGMWDNLGRAAAEYPHLREFRFGPGERVEVVGLEHVESMRDDGRPGLFFSGHLGNWELMGLGAVRHGVPVHPVYRAANNPRLEWLYRWGRDNEGVEMIPKGAAGARRAMQLLQKGEHVGMLVDQKMNDGIAVPFFGRMAMTAPALAAFALKYACPAAPTHVERLKGARFRLVVEPPLTFADTGDRHADILAAMTEVNRRLEGWIRQHPEQWLWLHRRWPDK
jgi:Kdo2-lipid IVA lauroyltransferase/acyltransferase